MSAPLQCATDPAWVHRLPWLNVSWFGRGTRILVALVVFGLLIAGTWREEDDQFPLGPFRMYASAVDNNGAVRAVRLDGVDDNGRPMSIRSDVIGMRPAEFEGQLPRLVGDQALLDGLARTYRRQQGRGPHLHELLLVERSFQLVDGRPTGDATEKVLAVGHA
jgi:hypothetical protein